MAAPQEQRIAVPIDDPNADTEWYGRADSQDALVSARANVLFTLGTRSCENMASSRRNPRRQHP